MAMRILQSPAQTVQLALHHVQYWQLVQHVLLDLVSQLLASGKCGALRLTV